LGEEVAGVVQQHPGGAGEPDVPAVPFEHGAADLAGQSGELLGNRGRCQMQGAGRGVDGVVSVELLQDQQTAYIEHHPIIQ
jgi:hypothetical protein